MPITATTILPFKYGKFEISFHKSDLRNCVSFKLGDVLTKVPIVRVHSSCLFGEAFCSLDCDCRQQLEKTLEKIQEYGHGVVIYTYSEGRGIGLEDKINAIEIERTREIDTVEAFKVLGLKPDLREYKAEMEALKDLGVNNNIKFVSQNPNKIKAIKDAGYIIDQLVELPIDVDSYNVSELQAKKNKLGYLIKI